MPKKLLEGSAFIDAIQRARVRAIEMEQGSANLMGFEDSDRMSYIRKLVTLCANCGGFYLDHADEKCLYAEGSFKPASDSKQQLFRAAYRT